MANEISLSVTLNVANGSYKPGNWSETNSYTQNTLGSNGGVMNLTTTFADIPQGSVATAGMMMVKNLDLTNSIDLGIDVTGTFTGVMTLKAGEVAVFRWKSGKVPAAVAVAGTPKMQFWLLSD